MVHFRAFRVFRGSQNETNQALFSPHKKRTNMSSFRTIVVWCLLTMFISQFTWQVFLWVWSARCPLARTRVMLVSSRQSVRWSTSVNADRSFFAIIFFHTF